MHEALLFGGTGQIGQPLLERLIARGWRVHAVSRMPQPARAGVTWVHGALDAMGAMPDAFDVVISAGPLDGFARWYAQTAVRVPRVVAQGVGAHATLLRPTLVYGAGRDASLTQIAALARRLGRFPLPRGATGGLRMPVHVEDLAEAALAVIEAPATFDKAYALPGGETLSYREMVARTLAAMSPPARLLELPPPLFALAVRAAQGVGIARSLTATAVARMAQDLVFDVAPAQVDFGYAPRGFSPTAAMLNPSAAAAQ
jgi:nucleoside-diphosphate-sugar epimerase